MTWYFEFYAANINRVCACRTASVSELTRLVTSAGVRAAESVGRLTWRGSQPTEEQKCLIPRTRAEHFTVFASARFLLGTCCGHWASLNDPVATHAAAFAVDELRHLSDSGIYETLELREVLSAQEQDGIFHHNVFLRVSLASPHYANRRETAEFDMIVMRSYDDGVLSFAIDE